MNYNMMFRRSAVLGLLLIFAFFLFPLSSKAAVPEGEVLIVYSDDADEEVMKNVYQIAELLTFGGVECTFAPAAECRGSLGSFQNVIFYELEKYPPGLFKEIQLIENGEAKRARENENYRSRYRFMFVGNPFLKEYLDRTERYTKYTVHSGEVGTFTYSFEEQNEKQSLAQLKEPIFYNGRKFDYQSGTMLVGSAEGYFCKTWDIITHVTTGDLGNPLVKAAFSKELFLWMDGRDQVVRQARYLVIDRVYPFQDPAGLLETIRELAENNIPFVISVMPVYDHGDYPAMQHFCEVLRYAQDKGGTVILHAPIHHMTEFDVDQMNESITTAMGLYIRQGVYPVGLQVPENWMSSRDTVEVMSRFGTILIAEETDPWIEGDWKEEKTNYVCRDAHQWIVPVVTLNEEDTGYMETHSTAVYLDLSKDMENLGQIIESMKNSHVPIKNLWEVSHSLWTTVDTITYENGILRVNGKETDRTFVPTEYEEEFSYQRNRRQRFSKDLTGENQKLAIAVAAMSILFIIFIIVARGNNRRRFFIKDEEEDLDAYWENKR